jgi:muramidase (phage lysozyme)
MDTSLETPTESPSKVSPKPPSEIAESTASKLTPNPSAESTPDKQTQPGSQDQPAAKVESSASAEPSQAEATQPTASVEIVVFDSHHHPIPNLVMRVLDMNQKQASKKILLEGKTNSKGALPVMENLPLGTRFEVQIKNDAGTYSFSAVGKVEVQGEHTQNIQIPRQRFEFTTYSHDGPPGKAEEKRQELVKRHNQQPADQPNITRNSPVKKPEVVMERSKDGNPVAIITQGFKNMVGINSPAVPVPNAGKEDLEKVQALIAFSTEQASWKYDDKFTSSTIVGKMKNSTLEKPDSKDPATSAHKCNKYVKVALWKAGYSGDTEAGPGISPAKDMGPALEKAGFQNVTKDIPDGRWAAPGDVIVYTKKGGGASADGHIDIRTYDGYISDFIGAKLPVSGFEVTGIYRRFCDPLPERRMHAFLEVIASRETKGIDVAKAPYALNTPIDGSKFSTDLKSHPWVGLELPESIKKGKSSTAAGRFQLTLTAWREAIERGNTLSDFSEVNQKRLAVIRLEYRGALGFVRKGDVEAAVAKLKSEWVTLPGGADAKGYSLEEMKVDFTKFLDE